MSALHIITIFQLHQKLFLVSWLKKWLYTSSIFSVDTFQSHHILNITFSWKLSSQTQNIISISSVSPRHDSYRKKSVDVDNISSIIFIISDIKKIEITCF